MNKQIFIIGSGASIRQGQWQTSLTELPIWNILKNKATISINWSYKWMIPTVSLFCDYKFYVNEKEGLNQLPLCVSQDNSFYFDYNAHKRHFKVLPDNLYFLKHSKELISVQEGKRVAYYGKDAWSKGFYASQLSGMYALNLAIALDYKEIFLLGFDATEIDGYTHFYQPEGIGIIKWDTMTMTGVGRTKRDRLATDSYNRDINWRFEPFVKELERINIYNVSLDSKINVFPKITYEEMISRINEEEINQTELRNNIITLIKG